MVLYQKCTSLSGFFCVLNRVLKSNCTPKRWVRWSKSMQLWHPRGYLYVRYKSVLHWQFLITYIFSVSLKFRACRITSVGPVQDKERSFKFACTFFLLLLNYVFIISFNEVSNFLNRILNNQKPKQVIRNCQWNYMIVIL